MKKKFASLEEIDKFLGTYNPPKLIHQEMENLIRLITSNKIEIIENFYQRKTQKHLGSMLSSI
jgi:hypothetical protein